MTHDIQQPWQKVSIEKDGVTFHGHYFVGPRMVTVLYGGHARSIRHEDTPLDELARRVLEGLVAAAPRTN